MVYEAGSLGSFLDFAPQVDVLVVDGELLNRVEVYKAAAREPASWECWS